MEETWAEPVILVNGIMEETWAEPVISVNGISRRAELVILANPMQQ
jgi:hypothetical protein